MGTDAVRCARRLLVLLALGPITLICATCSSRSKQTDDDGAHETKAANVYINLKGDSNLARRFSAYLKFALEDVGISRAISERNANLFVDGKLDAGSQTHDIGVGIVRSQLTQDGKTTKSNSCATLNSDVEGELFNGAANNTASQIRGKFPNARTIKLDSASDTKVSKVFSNQLSNELKDAGFALMDSGTPDVLLHIELLRQKVAVEERVAKLEIEIFGKGRELLGSTTGTTIVSAQLAGPPPEACPSQFEDLSWLAGNSLYNDANMLAKDLRKKSQKIGNLNEKTRK